MTKKRRAQGALVVIALAGCACLLLSGCTRLTASYHTDNGMTIRYPKGWEIEDLGRQLSLSPYPMDLIAQGQPTPIFAVDFSWINPVFLAVDPGQLLELFASENELVLGESLDVIGTEDVSWNRVAFSLDFLVAGQQMQGWVAVTVRPNSVIFVLAGAMTTDWHNHESTFEAMLESIVFD